MLLFSGGKDSIVMLHLAMKAFWPAKVPFGLLHVDTGHNFPEVLEYRDRTVAKHGLRLDVAKVQDYIDDGRLRERPDGTRNPLQTVPLLDAINAHRFDAVFGGGRRDEEKVRAKRALWQQRWETILAGIDAEDLRTTTRVLERLNAVFEDAPDSSECVRQRADGPDRQAG